MTPAYPHQPNRLMPYPPRRRAARSALRATLLASTLATACLPTVHAAAPNDASGNDRDSPTADAARQGVAPQPQHPDLPPLLAAPGITALSGRVVDLDGRGLGNVIIADNSESTRSDAEGRWVLGYAPRGASVLRLDARRLGEKSDQDYGFYEIRVEALPGVTTVLPWTSWLPRIDHAHDATINSPTTTETVVRTPAIPDLELRIPAGTVVRSFDGQPVTRVGITAVPFDRLPFPVPRSFRLPMFFVIQPGAACLYTKDGGIGQAAMRFPNWTHELPHARAVFWRYEPDANGWTPYGMGAVDADARQVVPEPGVEIYDFGSAECDPATRSHMDPALRQDVRRPLPAIAPAPNR